MSHIGRARREAERRPASPGRAKWSAEESRPGKARLLRSICTGASESNRLLPWAFHEHGRDEARPSTDKNNGFPTKTFGNAKHRTE